MHRFVVSQVNSICCRRQYEAGVEGIQHRHSYYTYVPYPSLHGPCLRDPYPRGPYLHDPFQVLGAGWRFLTRKASSLTKYMCPKKKLKSKKKRERCRQCTVRSQNRMTNKVPSVVVAGPPSVTIPKRNRSSPPIHTTKRKTISIIHHGREHSSTRQHPRCPLLRETQA